MKAPRVGGVPAGFARGAGREWALPVCEAERHAPEPYPVRRQEKSLTDLGILHGRERRPCGSDRRRNPKPRTGRARRARPRGPLDQVRSCRNRSCFSQTVAENGQVCPKCNYHFRISARERLESLFDEGAYEEFDAEGLLRWTRWSSKDTKTLRRSPDHLTSDRPGSRTRSSTPGAPWAGRR